MKAGCKSTPKKGCCISQPAVWNTVPALSAFIRLTALRVEQAATAVRLPFFILTDCVSPSGHRGLPLNDFIGRPLPPPVNGVVCHGRELNQWPYCVK